MNKFNPGDIITAYHIGYHQVQSVKNRQLTYKRIDGKRRTTNTCDSDWCELIDPEELHRQNIEEADDLLKLMLTAKATFQ